MLDKVIILSLCALVAFAVDPKDICAENGSDGLLLLHKNCNQFYNCVGSKPEVQTCPVGLLFNTLQQSCDWPENVDCSNRDVADADPTTTNKPDEIVEENETATAICAAEKSDGILVPHENCNQFYKCSEGKPVALSCPLNLLYNPKTEQCDWPENVDCSNRDISDVTPSQPDEISPTPSTSAPDVGNNENEIASAICGAEGSDGLLVPHENCNQFYKCSEGKPVALSCPLNLLYNPKTEQCDWPENVDCSNRDISDVTPSQPDEISPTPSSSAPDVGNNENEIASAICGAEGSDGLLVPHENCNQFYKCSEGKPVALSCPLNLLYNPKTEQCDWPENVDCSNRDISDVTPGQPDEISPSPSTSAPDVGNNENGIANVICGAQGSDGVLVPHENCNEFYKCSEGKPVALECPVNLLYNPKTEQCDWPENVICSNRDISHVIRSQSVEISPIPATSARDVGNNENKIANAICGDEGSDGILLPHENCNQFYMCSEGKPVALLCPLDLLYNPKTEQCDWPENVDCSNRDIPDVTSSQPDEISTTPSTSTTAGENNGNEIPSVICAAEGSDGTLLPHENCNQFYMCSEGAPVAMSCQPNLLYNIEMQYCDWAENVDCGDRS